MERFLVAFKECGKTEYGWVVDFSGHDAIIRRLNGTTFIIRSIFSIEVVYRYFHYNCSTDYNEKTRIEEAIKQYESRDKKSESELEEQEEQHHSGLISWH